MNRLQRTSPLATAAFAAVGVATGLLVQIARSAQGAPPLVPPLSLVFTMLLMAGLLVVLGVSLRRAVTRRSGKPVNPFHAVRLLAGARAGQFAGALLGGFGGGLALQLLTRSVMPPASSWAPMLLVLGGGLVLLACGIVTELLCRVPPRGPEDENEGENGSTGAEPDAA